jgi:hypothetical protein
MANATSLVRVTSPADERFSCDPTTKEELGLVLVLLLRRLTFSALMATSLPFWLDLEKMSFPMIGRNPQPRGFSWTVRFSTS